MRDYYIFKQCGARIKDFDVLIDGESLFQKHLIDPKTFSTQDEMLEEAIELLKIDKNINRMTQTRNIIINNKYVKKEKTADDQIIEELIQDIERRDE